MNNTELASALVTEGAVESQQDGEAVLDALASIIWHALEHNDVIEWSRVGQLGVASAPRRRRTVTFYAATELDVAVNRHHIEA
jgi:nucleoid DNA-binding protein